MKSITNNEPFYGTCILSSKTLANACFDPDTWKEILSFHKLLCNDEYTNFLDQFYNDCITNFGKHWQYMDIVSAVYTAAKIIKPTNYLEIGVRRGRSLCAAAIGNPEINILGIDLWVKNYAGMENPGEEFVKNELIKIHHKGKVEFINGNSHKILPDLFSNNPNLTFDLITVDGDHSEEGARQDLLTVIPHLSTGGVIIFDDISHPKHKYLYKVWFDILKEFPFLDNFEFKDQGYGVAFAIKRDNANV